MPTGEHSIPNAQPLGERSSFDWKAVAAIALLAVGWGEARITVRDLEKWRERMEAWRELKAGQDSERGTDLALMQQDLSTVKTTTTDTAKRLEDMNKTLQRLTVRVRGSDER